jgi:hypothetical protein
VAILLCRLGDVIKSVDYQRRLAEGDQARKPTFAGILTKDFSATPCSVFSRLMSNNAVSDSSNTSSQRCCPM